MSQDLGRSHGKAFSKMDFAERDAVLQDLSLALRQKTLVSKSVAFDRCRDMKRLRERIERDHRAIAADLECAAATVIEAIRLLSKLEQDLSGTRH